MNSRRRFNHSRQSQTDVFTDMQASYSAAQPTRFRSRLTGVSPMGSGADYHLSESDQMKLIESARAYRRNDPIISAAITRLIDSVLGGGVEVDPLTGNKEADALIKKKWKKWSDTPDLCDKSGEFTFRKLTEIAFEGSVVDGDISAILTNDGSVELLEAERLRTPRNTVKNVVLGVLLDKHRKRKEFWFTNSSVGLNGRVQRVKDITAVRARDANGNRQVLQVYDPRRISQTRGVSAFVSTFDFAGMHGDLQFAQLIKAQTASCIAILESLGIDSDTGGSDDPLGPTETEPLASGESRVIENIGPGIYMQSRPGSTIAGFAPNIPNAEFFEHAKMILTFISINIGLPLPVLLLDPSNTNFSGWRGSIDQAREGFRRQHKYMADQFVGPVYDWRMRNWVLEDPELAAFAAMPDVDIFNRRINPPSWRYIEPLKDAQADALTLEKFLSSPRRVLRKQGHEYDEVALEIVEDRGLLIRLALAEAIAINKQFAEAGVTWRDILVPETESVVGQIANNDESDENGGTND